MDEDEILHEIMRYYRYPPNPADAIRHRPPDPRPDLRTALDDRHPQDPQDPDQREAWDAPAPQIIPWNPQDAAAVPPPQQQAREKEAFYVRVGLFPKYYRITKYGEFNFNSALFVTPEREWYIIEPVRAKEVESDVRGPDALAVHGREWPCPGRVIPSAVLTRLLARAVGKAFILLVPLKPSKMPKVAPQYSYLGHELAQIAAAPAALAIFDGSPSRPRSLFTLKARCLASLIAALDALKAAGVG